jgi:hypothetical protein
MINNPNAADVRVSSDEVTFNVRVAGRTRQVTLARALINSAVRKELAETATAMLIFEYREAIGDALTDSMLLHRDLRALDLRSILTK